MKPIDIRKLGLGAKAGICWSFLWRGLLITVGSMLLGGVLGAVFGFIFALAGSSGGLSRQTTMQVAQYGGGVLGLASGLFFLYLYVRWLLGSRLGNYRLILVAADDRSNEPFHPTAPSQL